MELEDIKTKTMKEANISEAHYELFVKDFWNTIRRLLQDPLNIKMGLRIAPLGKWYLSYYKIIRLATNFTDNGTVRVYNRKYDLNTIKQLKLKLDNYYERYKIPKQDNE